MVYWTSLGHVDVGCVAESSGMEFCQGYRVLILVALVLK